MLEVSSLVNEEPKKLLIMAASSLVEVEQDHFLPIVVLYCMTILFDTQVSYNQNMANRTFAYAFLKITFIVLSTSGCISMLYSIFYFLATVPVLCYCLFHFVVL